MTSEYPHATVGSRGSTVEPLNAFRYAATSGFVASPQVWNSDLEQRYLAAPTCCPMALVLRPKLHGWWKSAVESGQFTLGTFAAAKIGSPEALHVSSQPNSATGCFASNLCAHTVEVAGE